MRFIFRRRLLAVLTVSLAAMLAFPAQAAYPDKPIRMIVPFAPGGGNDLLARAIAPKLGELLGQTIVVDNRPGAGGNIGAAEVAKAAPDGYTILMASNQVVINPSLYPNMSFDVMKDLVPVGILANVQFVLVANPGVAAKTVPELIALAKKSPSSLHHATPGSGTPQHLAAELFNTTTGVLLVHVPYKGTGPAVVDLLGGQVQLAFATLPSVKQHIDSGKLRALAMTGSKRSPLLPAVPTIEESGVRGYEASTWYGILAPAGTPPAVLQLLASALSRTVQDKDVQAKLIAQGFEPGVRAPAEMGNAMQSDLAKWATVVKQANVKVE